MARRHISGPTSRTPRNSMETVNRISRNGKQGVILRSAPGLDHETTLKSRMAPKIIRGIAPFGRQARNYPSPTQ